jgi:hypothetical protein
VTPVPSPETSGAAPTAVWWRYADAIVSASLLVGFFALYVATLTPGLAHPPGDGHELTVVAATLGLAHPTGYPVYTWLGFLFTRFVHVGDAAYRMNLMSAAGGAAGVAMAYLVGRRLDLRRPVATFAAFLVGISPTFWSQAVITEVYAPNLAMVGLLLWLLLGWADRVRVVPGGSDRRLAVFALVYGLSLGTHFSNLGFAPAFAVFVLLSDVSVLRRPWSVVVAVLAFVLGIAQFAWLPLRAGGQDLYPMNTPDTPEAVYRYTAGTFSNLRFAFPWGALLGRLATYVSLLGVNFGWPLIALGVVGMWSLIARNVRVFWLLVLMCVVHIVFFTQFFVPDPDPYFIPSHFVFALFVGMGVEAVFLFSKDRAARSAPSWVVASIPVVLGGILVGIVVPRGIVSLRWNDATDDTVVGDFYRAAFAYIPRSGVLIGRRGKFGSDIRYYHNLQGVRPDVVVPDRTTREVSWQTPVFTTPEQHPVGATVRLPPRAWFTPVLQGARHDATLYLVTRTPMPLLVWDATPAVRVDRYLGDGVLVGYDVPLAQDGRVRMKTYWSVEPSKRVVIATQLDETMLEAHELGFDNLPRYRAERGFTDGGVAVEVLDVVVPRSVPAGIHALRVGAIDFASGGVHPRWIDLGPLKVP